jgi:hypothetical protein
VKIIHATLVALTFALTGSVARAEEDAPPAKIFDDYVAHTEGSRAARAALEDVAKSCDFSVFSRSGPRPSQIAGCERSVQRAVAVGPSVVPDALRALNDDELGYGARIRTYDVLARVGDVRSLESLVTALGKLPDEAPDRAHVLNTLARISYASVGEMAPFSEKDPEPKEVTAAWRSWLDAHRGMSQGELLSERLANARQHAADADIETAFIAARFLVQRKATEKEGIAALKNLLGRSNLASAAADSIRELMEESTRTRRASSDRRVDRHRRGR